MYTTINEFIFSKHYKQSRFNERITNCKILNQLNNPELAKLKLNQVLNDIGINILSTLELDPSINAAGVVFGEIYFKQNDILIPALLKSDDNKGNIFLAIIKDNVVVTIVLMKLTHTNQQLYDKVSTNHPNDIKILVDTQGNFLPTHSDNRPKIIIDLDNHQ